MLLRRVDQTIGNQPHNVNCSIGFDGAVHRRVQSQVVKELAGFDLMVDSFQVSKQHAARAEAQMAYIRIAHHTSRQTDALARGLDQSVRIFLAQLVIERHVGLGDRVAFTLSAIAKAVEKDQCQRSFEWHKVVTEPRAVASGSKVKLSL